MKRLTLSITGIALLLALGSVAACDGSATATRIARDEYATAIRVAIDETATAVVVRYGRPMSGVQLRHAATREAKDATATVVAAKVNATSESGAATREAGLEAYGATREAKTATRESAIQATREVIGGPGLTATAYAGEQATATRTAILKATRTARQATVPRANSVAATRSAERAREQDGRRNNDCGLKSIGAKPEYPFDTRCIVAIREGLSDQQLEDLIDAELNHAVQLALDGWPSSSCYDPALDSHRPRAFSPHLSSFCNLLFINNFHIR